MYKKNSINKIKKQHHTYKRTKKRSYGKTSNKRTQKYGYYNKNNKITKKRVYNKKKKVLVGGAGDTVPAWNQTTSFLNPQTSLDNKNNDDNTFIIKLIIEYEKKSRNEIPITKDIKQDYYIYMKMNKLKIDQLVKLIKGEQAKNEQNVEVNILTNEKLNKDIEKNITTLIQKDLDELKQFIIGSQLARKKLNIDKTTIIIENIKNNKNNKYNKEFVDEFYKYLRQYNKIVRKLQLQIRTNSLYNIIEVAQNIKGTHINVKSVFKDKIFTNNLEHVDNIYVVDGQSGAKCGLHAINNLLQLKNPDCFATVEKCKIQKVLEKDEASDGNNLQSQQLVALINGSMIAVGTEQPKKFPEFLNGNYFAEFIENNDNNIYDQLFNKKKDNKIFIGLIEKKPGHYVAWRLYQNNFWYVIDSLNSITKYSYVDGINVLKSRLKITIKEQELYSTYEHIAVYEDLLVNQTSLKCFIFTEEVEKVNKVDKSSTLNQHKQPNQLEETELGLTLETKFKEKIPDFEHYYIYVKLCNDYLFKEIKLENQICDFKENLVEVGERGSSGFTLTFTCQNNNIYTIKLLINLDNKSTLNEFIKRAYPIICKEFSSINDINSKYILKVYKYFLYDGKKFNIYSKCNDNITENEVEIINGDSNAKIKELLNKNFENPVLFTGLILENIQYELEQVNNKNINLSSLQIITLFYHYLLGISYMNKKKKTHTDIKIGNLMFNNNNEIKGKIIDLGGVYTFDIDDLKHFNVHTLEVPGYEVKNIINNKIKNKQEISLEEKMKFSKFLDKYDLYMLGLCFTNLLGNVAQIDKDKDKLNTLNENVLKKCILEDYTHRLTIDEAIALTQDLEPENIEQMIIIKIPANRINIDKKMKMKDINQIRTDFFKEITQKNMLDTYKYDFEIDTNNLNIIDCSKLIITIKGIMLYLCPYKNDGIGTLSKILPGGFLSLINVDTDLKKKLKKYEILGITEEELVICKQFCNDYFKNKNTIDEWEKENTKPDVFIEKNPFTKDLYNLIKPIISKLIKILKNQNPKIEYQLGEENKNELQEQKPPPPPPRQKAPSLPPRLPPPATPPAPPVIPTTPPAPPVIPTTPPAQKITPFVKMLWNTELYIAEEAKKKK